jgi:hypothetical protein
MNQSSLFKKTKHHRRNKTETYKVETIRTKMPSPTTELDEEYEKAKVEVEQLLGATKPKHLGEGLTSGVGK